MSTDPYPAAVGRDFVREIAGAAAVLSGVGLLTVAGFMWCQPAGVAVIATVLIVAGIILGYRR